MLLSILYLNNKKSQYMNKPLLAKEIVELLDLPSYSKRIFLEDIQHEQWLHDSDELTSVIHTELLLATSLDNLKDRLNSKREILTQIIEQLENQLQTI